MENKYLSNKELTRAIIRGLYDVYCKERIKLIIWDDSKVLFKERKRVMFIFSYKQYVSQDGYLLFSPFRHDIVTESKTNIEFSDIVEEEPYFKLTDKLYVEVLKTVKEFKEILEESTGRKTTIYNTMKVLNVSELPHNMKAISSYINYSDYKFEEYLELFKK